MVNIRLQNNHRKVVIILRLQLIKLKYYYGTHADKKFSMRRENVKN